MNKIYFLLAFIMLTGATLFAQNVELSNKLIQQYETSKQKALSKDATTHDHLWLTPLLNEAVKNWNDLTNEAKVLFSKAKDRPTFIGTENILTLGNFALHYTLDGPTGESIDPTDANSNSFPDYAENMLYTFSDIYDLYHTTTELTVPPNDADEVNGAYYDIYVSGDEAGAGVYGYVAPETDIGDNPNSTGLTEYDAYTSFMVMRNNYDGFPNGNTDIPMEVTAAHEYMHATQMGYSQSMDIWFMEACAVWSEDFAFPGHDDNLQYLGQVFGSPDVALNLENGEAGGAFDGHWYGAWIFMKYMTEHTGNNIVKNIYERCINYYAETAIEQELTSNWSSNFGQIFAQFIVANTLMTSDAQYAPYTYSRASVYDDYITNNGGYEIESTVNYSGTDISYSSYSDGNGRLMRLSYDYVVVTTNDDFQVILTPWETDEEVDIMLVKFNSTSGNFELQTPEYSGDQAIINVTDQENFDALILIVARLDRTAADANSSDYSLYFTDAQTSIEKNEYNFEIYPNPANDFVNIINNEKELLNINITDITGKVIITQEFTGNSKINVHDLDNGIYFLSIFKDNKIIKIEKLIVSH